MKHVKFENGVHSKRYVVDRGIFEQITDGAYPFVQVSKDTGAVSRYAICPHCENPAQLIRLYSESSARAPYAAHTGKTIEGFKQYNARAYINCPFAANRRLPDDNERYQEPDERDKELYYLLRDQFDRVAYLGRKVLGIRFSNKAMAEILGAYVTNRGYLYPWLSISNLYMSLFFFGAQHKSIYGQFIQSDSELCEAIKQKCPEVQLLEADKLPGYSQVWKNASNPTYFTLLMRFAKHEQIVNADGELKDVFTVCVDKNSYNANGGEEIFRTQIECDELYFWNLTHSKNETNRDKSLCDIAKDVMRDL